MVESSTLVVVHEVEVHSASDIVPFSCPHPRLTHEPDAVWVCGVTLAETRQEQSWVKLGTGSTANHVNERPAPEPMMVQGMFAR